MRPTLKDVQEAHKIVTKIAHRTPIMYSRTFSEMADAQVYLKAENLQRTGSFKIRGAANRIASIPTSDRRRGVVTASAGNHAQGVALASQRLGVKCLVVMPKGASPAKMEATKGYGAEILLIGDTFDDAQAEAHRLALEKKMTFIPAFDDAKIIAGQGTIGLEICHDLPELQAVAVPIGGGGLISGVALVIKELKPSVKVYGVQAEACPSAVVATQKGRRIRIHPKPTIADGIAVGRTGELPFGLIKRYVDDIVTVSEEEVAHAIVLLLERAKLLVEGAGAVGLAAIVNRRLSCKGRKVVALLSGGNVDPLLLSRVLDFGLAHAGRFLSLRVIVRDTPGQLAKLLDTLAEAQANIIEVVHHRRGIHLPIGLVQVELTIETRNPDHARRVTDALEEKGYVPLRYGIGAVFSQAGTLYFAAQGAYEPQEEDTAP